MYESLKIKSEEVLSYDSAHQETKDSFDLVEWGERKCISMRLCLCMLRYHMPFWCRLGRCQHPTNVDTKCGPDL